MSQVSINALIVNLNCIIQTGLWVSICYHMETEIKLNTDSIYIFYEWEMVLINYAE